MPQYRHPFVVQQLFIAFAIVILFIIVGCATTEDLAPLVDATTIELAGAHEIDINRLQRGRALYITSCAQCHRPEPIVRYAQDEWRQILPRMGMYARLTPDDAGALRAYVVTILDASKSESPNRP